MKEISQFLSYLLPVLYLVVLYVYYAVFTGKKKNWTEKTTLFLVVLVIIHGIEIAFRNIAIKTIPLSTTHDALCFLAFSIIVVYMILELSLKNRGSGLIILFFAFILEIISTINLS
jgi:ABC-type transport system involved in cytochrome c biogenesis permease subunit